MLLGGVRGHKGAGGRPSDAHRQWCAKLIENPKSRAAAKRILENDKHPAFAAMWKTVAERAYGKAAQQVIHTGEGGGPIRFTLTIGQGDGDGD